MSAFLSIGMYVHVYAYKLCVHLCRSICVCMHARARACVHAHVRLPCAYKLYKGINQSFVDFFYLWAKPFKQVGRTFKRVIIFSPYR